MLCMLHTVSQYTSLFIMLCSVLIAALVAALVVVPFRPAARLLVAAALALLVCLPQQAPTNYSMTNHSPMDRSDVVGRGCWDLDADGKCIEDHDGGATGPPGPIGVTGACWDRNGNDDTPPPRPRGPVDPIKDVQFGCWDFNKNSLCDSFEDTNGDGICDEKDCMGPQPVFEPVKPAATTHTAGLYVPPPSLTSNYGIYVNTHLENAKQSLGELREARQKRAAMLAELFRLTRDTNEAVANWSRTVQVVSDAAADLRRNTENLVSALHPRPWYKQWFG
jgi:hypothetical protein